MVAEDIDELIAWACSQGWTVTVDANGYRRFHTPRRNLRDLLPGHAQQSPAGRLLDVVTDVRRRGLTWPPPSKKEQRAQRRKEGRP